MGVRPDMSRTHDLKNGHDVRFSTGCYLILDVIYGLLWTFACMGGYVESASARNEPSLRIRIVFWTMVSSLLTMTLCDAC